MRLNNTPPDTCQVSIAPGLLTATWQPGEIANGVYLVKASLPDGTLTEKLMLLR